MPRATLIISADAPGEREAADRWFEAWGGRMTFVSGNTGCGCCVDIYDVEGPLEAIDAIPTGLSAQRAERLDASQRPRRAVQPAHRKLP